METYFECKEKPDKLIHEVYEEVVRSIIIANRMLLKVFACLYPPYMGYLHYVKSIISPLVAIATVRMDAARSAG